MITQRNVLSTGALAVALSIAAAGVASGHGSVHTDTARIVSDANTNPPTLADQTRYVVSNHGHTLVLRESNGVTTKGMVDHKRIPGAYRNHASITMTQRLAEGDTGAQPHATCDVPALTSEAAVVGWQGADPFYNYVPFQSTAAGLDDDPADWIDDVAARTGVDLTGMTTAQAATACAAISGTYVPADQVQTTAASLSSGTVAAATTPIEAARDEAVTRRAAAEGELAALRGTLASVQVALAAARDEIARMTAGMVPLKVVPGTASFSRAGLAGGVGAAVTGPAGRPVNVRVLVTEARARQLGLRSRILATTTDVIGSDGTARLTLRSSSTAARGLARLRGTTAVTFSALSGDRVSTATARLGR